MIKEGCVMLRIREAIVVEGRYDRQKLAPLVDTVIVETRGFGIFNDRERLAYLRRLAATRGLIILTDSDSAGQVIRNYLKGSIPTDRLRHAFVPELLGKERRKDKPSRAGTLGVEGMPSEVLLRALRRAGAIIEDEDAPPPVRLSKADLYAAGLSGGEGSASRRAELCRRMGFPKTLTANALLDALTLSTRVDFEQTLREMDAGSAGTL